MYDIARWEADLVALSAGELAFLQALFLQTLPQDHQVYNKLGPCFTARELAKICHLLSIKPHYQDCLVSVIEELDKTLVTHYNQNQTLRSSLFSRIEFMRGGQNSTSIVKAIDAGCRVAMVYFCPAKLQLLPTWWLPASSEEF